MRHGCAVLGAMMLAAENRRAEVAHANAWQAFLLELVLGLISASKQQQGPELSYNTKVLPNTA